MTEHERQLQLNAVRTFLRLSQDDMTMADWADEYRFTQKTVDRVLEKMGLLDGKEALTINLAEPKFLTPQLSYFFGKALLRVTTYCRKTNKWTHTYEGIRCRVVKSGDYDMCIELENGRLIALDRRAWQHLQRG